MIWITYLWVVVKPQMGNDICWCVAKDTGADVVAGLLTRLLTHVFDQIVFQRNSIRFSF